MVLDCLDPEGLIPFWHAALGYTHVWSAPGFEVLQPAEGEPPGPVLILQQVPEPRTGKNRMHLDVHPPLELGVPALVERLESLGGHTEGEPVTALLESSGIWWQSMTDPEGNIFCVVADPGHPAPASG